MEGPLSKWTNIVKGWQFRWFVLEEGSGALSYYLTREKRIKNSKRGVIPLQGALIGIDDEDDSTFTITVQNHTYHFQARHTDEKERWIEALELVIFGLKNPKVEEKPARSMEAFDQKLAESDAYLQMLIEEVQETEQKIEQAQDDAVKQRYVAIKQTAESVIESIKQSIVLLQIAKANNRPEVPQVAYAAEALPNTDGKSGMTANPGRPGSSHGSTASDPGTSRVMTPTLNNRQMLVTVDDSTHRVKEDVEGPVYTSPGLLLGDPGNALSTRASGGLLLDPSKPRDLTVPASDLNTSRQSSVSSSDDEQFYDCDETAKSAASPSSSRAAAVAEAQDSHVSEPPPIVASVFDHYDELYDDDASEDIGSVQSQGNIITHLMSQVRIGMDLTKIVLPTFILERRSLLEMFADFLAHPDMFISIPDQKTPQDRMVQCVRWYLSAFHAGRRTDVAKKPYNPILGETFQCCYDLPDMSLKGQKLASEGPVPWGTQEHVCFVAEQVSHHPPISAFYAEHLNKGISLDGYIWTKSKFLGLSIGVHMVGQGVISVLKYDEEYTITFPNAYGRSILTVPWMELGGSVNIHCSKTGYRCTVEFHTKPFYGGKKDQITAEIFAPGEKKPFCTVKGEWNGVMWAKYSSGMNEKFVDTTTSPIRKKLVRPIDEQRETESRRLWRDVTYHLKNKDIEKATDFKRQLEDNQRKAAKERDTSGNKWETKYFHEVGEHWIYRRPLESRLHQTRSGHSVYSNSSTVQN